MFRSWQKLVLALTGCAVLCQPAWANDYPNRSIRIVLGLAAGGGDAFARVLSEELRKLLIVPVVVEKAAK